MSKRLPRVIIVRHGQTEWSLNGRHTGVTDIPLTTTGEELIVNLGKRVVGAGNILDPNRLSHVFVSPRHRAQKTYELLFSGLPQEQRPKNKVTEERVKEWTYGDFEGALAKDVNADRASRGQKKWDIWTEGCSNGESPQEMSDRADSVVQTVKDLHNAYMQADGPGECGDILIISHGHFSRVFVARWLGLPIEQGQLFSVDVGGVSIGTYYHSLDKPCLGALNAGSF